MLNHDTGQMDWDRQSVGSPDPLPSSYYINPQNMYDVSTPRGRELLDEIYPSSDEDGLSLEKGKGSLLAFVLIVVFMFVGFFIIPGHS